MSRTVRFLITLSVVAIHFLWPRTGYTGGADGAGGDTQFLSTTAWFTGVRPIWYCLEVDPKFGIGVDEAEAEFLRAVATWRAYLDEHSGMAIAANLNYQRAPRCGGWEDFTLYLGVDNAAVTEGRRHYEAPLAFAERTAYRVDQGWGKGFVWVARGKAALSPDVHAPDWSLPHRLRAMLVHELGHVLGCGHVPGTVLDARLAESVIDVGAEDRAARLAEIDHSIQLLSNFAGANVYAGRVGPRDSLAARNTFQRFFGRPPAGPVSAQLRVEGSASNLDFKVMLSAKDGSGDHVLEIPFTGAPILFDLARDIFSTVTATGHSSHNVNGRMAFSNYTASGGRIYNIAYELNSHQASPVKLRYFWDGKEMTLFETIR